MNILRKQYMDLRSEAQKAERDLKTAFPDYRLAVAEQKRKDIRAELQAKTTETLKGIRASADKRLQDIETELLHRQFPRLSSSDMQQRLVGELEQLNARLSPQLYDLDELRTAAASGRRDYVSTLIYRALTADVPKTEQDIAARHAYLREAKKIDQDMDQLQAERRDLNTLQQEIGIFQTQVDSGFRVNDFPVELMGRLDQTPLRVKD